MNVLPAPELAVDPELPAVESDEAAGQRQPEARALPLAGLLELLEDPLVIGGVDPDAGVAHRHRRPCRRRGTASTSTRPPSGVNFTALDSRLNTTCLTLRSSASIVADPGRDLEAEGDAVVGGPLPHHGQAALQDRRQRERGRVELHLPRLDLGQVEDVVDEAEQVAPGGEDVVEVVGLALVERRRTSAPAALRRSR